MATFGISHWPRPELQTGPQTGLQAVNNNGKDNKFMVRCAVNLLAWSHCLYCTLAESAYLLRRIA
jgi:hypothetical protein